MIFKNPSIPLLAKYESSQQNTNPPSKIRIVRLRVPNQEGELARSCKSRAFLRSSRPAGACGGEEREKDIILVINTRNGIRSRNTIIMLVYEARIIKFMCNTVSSKKYSLEKSFPAKRRPPLREPQPRTLLNPRPKRKTKVV
jgi:hypothetical protein